MAELLLVSWMIGIVYSSIPLFWFAIHPLVQRWRRMRRSPYRILLPLWFAISALITFPLMVMMEEKELVKRFGQAYRDYQRTVPLVPFIWKRTWRNEETA